MLDHYLDGATAACSHFGVKLAAVTPGTGSMLDKIKSFGQGQMDAAKSLFHNVRGGVGGKFSPEFKGNLAGMPEAEGLNRAAHRQMAVGNLKTLAPSLLAGGGLYLIHKRRQEAERQRQLQMQQQAYSPQPM